MVSFSCEVCNDTVIKKKLDQHQRQCYGAYFTCIDCSTTFQGTEYRNHTSCISEAEKYEKALYKGKKQAKPQPKQPQEIKQQEVRKEAKKEVKKEVKEKASKVVAEKKSKKSDLAQFLGQDSSSLYKVVKAAAKSQKLSTKDVLKSLKVVQNEDGSIAVAFK
ncbi:unnamed protein product [Kuraishia capsulata CBS 1993]|uniref:Zinc finger C2H2 LYAR-type domain-containing protein n=1 Tax=Kuraishia capsulata CBS 1993 TaxID=1382522 RepID=W6MJ20_9ASCO|nr:uncharacterized protein KUCA_T00002177001 [Kuraishia capsulata CBS 1993]CDK26206.1 unnamed protein product [Kuraishia capsulata CBS 1993]